MSVFAIDTGQPPTATGQRPILFLHGLGGSARTWRPQLDALAPTARGVAWTMPGYGPSPPLAETTIATLTGAAARLLDDRGIERADVVGHSLGGYVAQELALTAPDRVGALVLMATTAAFGKPGSTFNDEFLAARLEPLDRGRTPADLAPSVVADLVGPDATDDVRQAAIESMSDIGVDGYRRALAALVAWDGRDRLGRIVAPTLCLAGADDGTAPPRAMERLAAAIPGAELAVVEGGGHLVNLERPDEVTDLLRRFLLR